MKKYKKTILLLCLVVTLIILIFCYFLSFWVVLPTESLSNTLTLARYGYVSPSRIILRHYINDVHICDYTLDLKVELRHQTVQHYELPQLDNGWVEVCVELKNNKGNINTRFDHVKDLYERGLLIYYGSDLSDIDRYVHFISGENKTCFHNKNGVFDWEFGNDESKIIKYSRQEISYSPGYYGWKENRWFKTQRQ